MAGRWATAAATLGLLFAASAPSPSAAAEPFTPRSFTIAASGEITIQQSLWEMADSLAPGALVYDFTPLFAPIEPWVSAADLAICHLEASLSSDNRRIRTQPRFSAPRELADAIAWTGYDLCSTASNHALDWGLAGLTTTLDVLDEAGVGHTGTSRSAEEDRPLLFDVNGVTVAFAAYTIGTNGRYVPQQWAVNYLRVDEMLADAAWAREQGAEFVILGLHWGFEYQEGPAGHQIQMAEELTGSGNVDLIVGHHAHVVQPIEYFNGVPVIYGMSNHFSNIRGEQAARKYGAEDGFIVHAEVTEQPGGGFEVSSLTVTPTWMHPITKQILPIEHTLARGAGTIAAELRTSLRRTIERLGRRGVHPPTSPTPWPEASCRGRIATVIGTPGDDLLIGTDGGDVIVSRGGDDSIWAGGGDDVICAGDGDDFVNGGAGHDLILAGQGDDLILGGEGHDTIWGGSGDDVLGGGEGDDLLVGEPGNDGLIGGGGDDTLWCGSGRDRADGGAGIDFCVGAATISSCER